MGWWVMYGSSSKGGSAVETVWPTLYGTYQVLETTPDQNHALRRRDAGEDVHGGHIQIRGLLLGNFGFVLNNIGDVDGAGHVANIFCTTKQGQ
jgi:hypothetical protein